MNSKFHRYKFTRQKPILDYIVDFYCHELALVIEIDGESHIGREAYDVQRTQDLETLEIHVLRYTNDECTKSLAGVRESLDEWV